MHLTRPKSSKGRSRPAVSDCLCSGESDGSQRSPVSPDRPKYKNPDRNPDRNLRSQSQPIMWQSGQLSQDEVLQMLHHHHSPSAPPQTLNKYKVLPSIGRRRSQVEKKMSTLSLTDDAVLQQRQEEPDLHAVKDVSSSEVDRADPGPGPTKEAGGLLLAIRAPCGRRFQQSFDPADTLKAVRASAEVRFGAQYGEASIETMDVPRRTFTDMDMTLAQCGVLNRSVLCISQSDGGATHE